jgi:uncharacterized protein (DUF486 family)
MILPLVLLTLSNIFMTFAWYGHLKFQNLPLLTVILLSWGLAFFEYCLMVPANRLGYQVYSAYQLKVFQEVITLVVFVVFAWTYLGQKPQWNHGLAFVLIAAGVALASLPPKSGTGIDPQTSQDVIQTQTPA